MRVAAFFIFFIDLLCATRKNSCGSGAICEFSGITVFLSYFCSAENTRLRKSQTAQGAGTLALSLPKNLKNMNAFEFLKSQQNMIDKLSPIYGVQPNWMKNYTDFQLKIPKIPEFHQFSNFDKFYKYFETFNRIEEISSLKKTKEFLNIIDSVTSKLSYLNYDFSELLENNEENDDVEIETKKSSIIITETSRIKDIISEIYFNNLKLFTIHPREFEKIIAELLYNKGFDVELTKQTRDNGYDILALKYINGFSPIKYLVECKRYAEDRKIGVEIIRSFKEVLQTENANKGIIVTTSYFTKDAIKKQAETPLLLDYKNKDEVLEWVKDYFNQKTYR